MKLVSHGDLGAPIADVFAVLTDFSAYERMALRRGIRILRRDRLPQPGLGTQWDAEFVFRGRESRASSHVSSFEPPGRLALEGRSGGYDFTLTVTLLALSREQTRLRCDIEARPKSLGARVVLQTLRLGKTRLQSRFDARVEAFVLVMCQRLGVAATRRS